MPIQEYDVSSPVPQVAFSIPSGPKRVFIGGEGIKLDTSGDVILRTSFDGTNFDSASDTYAADVDGTWSGNRTSLPIFTGAMGASGNSFNPLNFQFTVWPGDEVMRAALGGRAWGYHTSDRQATQHHSGYRKATGRILAVQIIAPANFTRGSFYIGWL
jgi:hypothetical protein